MINSSEERINELESKVLFQEDIIERLSGELRKQQIEILELKEKLDLIIQSLNSQDSAESKDERPPHY
jgi:SlyX protein